MTWIQADFVVLERPSPHTMTGIVMIWFQLMQNHKVKGNVAITIRFKLLGCIDWIWRRRTRRPFCWHILKYWDGQYIFASNRTSIWVFHGGYIWYRTMYNVRELWWISGYQLMSVVLDESKPQILPRVWGFPALFVDVRIRIVLIHWLIDPRSTTSLNHFTRDFDNLFVLIPNNK
jgi:hypothetical protein